MCAGLLDPLILKRKDQIKFLQKKRIKSKPEDEPTGFSCLTCLQPARVQPWTHSARSGLACSAAPRTRSPPRRPCNDLDAHPGGSQRAAQVRRRTARRPPLFAAGVRLVGIVLGFVPGIGLRGGVLDSCAEGDGGGGRPEEERATARGGYLRILRRLNANTRIATINCDPF
jgi:hypothetical protein